MIGRLTSRPHLCTFQTYAKTRSIVTCNAPTSNFLVQLYCESDTKAKHSARRETPRIAQLKNITNKTNKLHFIIIYSTHDYVARKKERLELSYCIGVWGGVPYCTSPCGDLN